MTVSLHSKYARALTFLRICFRLRFSQGAHMTCMYPPPHMAYMYPPFHMTYMYPPPHMTCATPFRLRFSQGAGSALWQGRVLWCAAGL